VSMLIAALGLSGHSNGYQATVTIARNTGDFVRRHQDILKSVYLRNIDKQRVKADYPPSLKHFYNLVLIFNYFFKIT
jgi:hypothetical protein